MSQRLDPQLVEHAFEARVRRRWGDAALDLVEAPHIRRDHLCAQVKVSWDSYAVAIDLVWGFSWPLVVATCSCPMGQRFEPCGHLWALIQAGLGQTPASQPPPAGKLAILAITDGNDVALHRPPQTSSAVADEAAEYLWESGALARILRGSCGDPDGALLVDDRWRTTLRMVIARADFRSLAAAPDWVARARLEYVLLTNPDDTDPDAIEIQVVRRTSASKSAAARPTSLTSREIERLPDADDRSLCHELFGVRSGLLLDAADGATCALARATWRRLLPRLCATGRFGWTGQLDESFGRRWCTPLVPLAWDGDEPYALTLKIDPAQAGAYRVQLALTRGTERLPPVEVVAVPCRELVLLRDRLITVAPDAGVAAWLTAIDGGMLVDCDTIEVPEAALDEFVETLCTFPSIPHIEFPPGTWQLNCQPPVPVVAFELPRRAGAKLRGRVAAAYGDVVVAPNDRSSAVVDRHERTIRRRDRAAEEVLIAQLRALGATVDARGELRTDAAAFPALVRSLVEAGWEVTAEGKPIRRPGAISATVKSGIDWFDVELVAEFAGAPVAAPALLEALRSGDGFIQLDDGSQGLVPEEWLRQFAGLAALGRVRQGGLRFGHAQASLLDALLAAVPKVEVDEVFAQARATLRRFESIEPCAEPQGFQGALRPYQRDGLGWLHFLRELGFGGCLADDMGLGKTIQVLAMIAGTRRGARRPVLIVAPRSLTFNWLDEAARFTPGLRVLDYTGTGRRALRERFDDADVVVTTYGTVLRDVAKLVDYRFDTIILDEAQTIKNGTAKVTKACRALTADHRLALTGTPVENRLADLASIFEFLNPGMLGRVDALEALADTPGPEGLSALARALRPFLLRRTKQQVLTELPDKTEQTIYCTLDKTQRKLYDELKDHYRAVITRQLDKESLAKAKMHVLEALLRLRQAACHPGLVDRERDHLPSAKLETLLERLAEVTAAGHKALIFSQFTTFLSMARQRLDERGVQYEYLDGRTRDRKANVERFQTDPDCRAFLISLKAGGHGLNLTAAEYVFLLDPWWNPAVEAQAIDRAHRMGQTGRVFAYRLIAKDTVEDKILELQRDKRELAEGIFTHDASVLSALTRDDLTRLLS